MNTYKINWDVNNYRQLQWCDSETNIMQLAAQLQPGSEIRTLPEVKWMQEEGVTDLPKPDLAYLQGFSPSLIVNEKAYAALSSGLGDLMDRQDVSVDGEPWVLLKLKAFTDNALLLDQCQFKVRRSGGIGRLIKAVYSPDVLGANPLILAEQDVTTLIATDTFIQLVEDKQLTGLIFE